MARESTVVRAMSPTKRRLVGSLLFAGLWALAAATRPTTTFHLAPVIVAVWPGLGGGELPDRMSPAFVGGAIAVTATVLLSAAGWLRGPSLLPWGGAALESALAAGVGVIVGLGALLPAGRRARVR